jgi:hypothetical protein
MCRAETHDAMNAILLDQIPRTANFVRDCFMRISILMGLIAVTSLIPAVARADGPTFGRRGQLALSWDQALITTAGIGSAPGGPPGSASMLDVQYESASNNGGAVSRFGLAPTADYFIIDHLSLGAQILGSVAVYSPNTGTGATTTSFGLAPQVGYNINVTSGISLWPKIFFGYATRSTDHGGISVNATAIGAFVPVLFHPVSHFYIGIGPNFSTELSSNVSGGGTSTSTDGTKITAVGLMATFGGYFLGDPAPEPTPAPAPAPAPAP